MAQKLVFIVLLAPLLFSQDQPIIRASSRLVSVNVLAQDSKGEPVRDLTADDFILSEGGKRRPIQFFSVETKLGTASTELPFSNRAANGDANLIIVLFDEYNTDPPDAARAREQLIRTLGGLPANSSVALYALSHELKIVRDFTTNHGVLAARMAAHQPSIGFSTDTLDPEAEQPGYETGQIGAAVSDLRAAREVHRSLATMQALRKIALHVTGLPGHKTLVWITGGVPVVIGRGADHNLTAEAMMTSRILERADITVDVVDVRGLRPTTQRIRPPKDRQLPLEVDTNSDSMVLFAHETGGEVFRNNNDVGNALERAVRNSSVSYAIGFYIPADELDGKYHSLKIQSARRGVKVRCRTGFFAEPDPPAQQRLSQPLEQLLGGSPSMGEIQLRADVQRDAAGGYRLSVFAGPDGMSLVEKDGVWSGEFEWIVAAARDGAYAPSQGRRLRIGLKPADYQEFLRKGLTVTQAVQPGAQDTEIGIAIRNVATGAVGTLRLFRTLPRQPR